MDGPDPCTIWFRAARTMRRAFVLSLWTGSAWMFAWARSESPAPRELNQNRLPSSPSPTISSFSSSRSFLLLPTYRVIRSKGHARSTQELATRKRGSKFGKEEDCREVEKSENSWSISLEGIGANKSQWEVGVLLAFLFSVGLSVFMEEGLLQSQITSMDKTANAVLDIEGLPQQPDKCCTGSPKMTRALSRKGSNRMERRGGEEQEQEDLAKKLIIKVVPSQLEQLKLPLVQNKTLVAPQCAACTPVLTDSGEGRNKRFNRLTSVHPRKILLFFATLSSVGTMILIYFTLAINSKAEA